MSRKIIPEMYVNRIPFDYEGIFHTNTYSKSKWNFTMHSEQMNEDLPLVSTKYLIPRGAKESIRWKLRKIGITRSLIFLGLDSTSYGIVKWHQVNTNRISINYNYNFAT